MLETAGEELVRRLGWRHLLGEEDRPRELLRLRQLSPLEHQQGRPLPPGLQPLPGWPRSQRRQLLEGGQLQLGRVVGPGPQVQEVEGGGGGRDAGARLCEGHSVSH